MAPASAVLVAAVPARADLRRARLDEFALQPCFPTRAATCGGIWNGRPRLANSVLPASCVSAEQPAGGSGRSSWRGSRLGGGLHAWRLLGRIRRGAGDRRACGDPGGARSAWSRRPALVAEAGTEAVKLRLKRTNEDAKLRGIFGAPTFVTEDGEMFWGNDHLEKAIAWALATPRTNVPV